MHREISRKSSTDWCKSAIVQRAHPCRLGRLHGGIRVPVQCQKRIRQIQPPYHQAEQRHKYIIHQGGGDLAEGGALS